LCSLTNSTKSLLTFFLSSSNFAINITSSLSSSEYSGVYSFTYRINLLIRSNFLLSSFLSKAIYSFTNYSIDTPTPNSDLGIQHFIPVGNGNFLDSSIYKGLNKGDHP